MRKLIITVVIIGVIVGLYYWVSKNAQVTLSALEGVKVKARRGDLNIPITASGTIQPASITEIKGKASGEVKETPFDAGMMVRKGDVIIRLEKLDEQRNVDRAESDLARAQIELEKAQIAWQEAKDVGVPSAAAKLQQTQARLDLAAWDFKHQEDMKEKERTTGLSISIPLEYGVKKAQRDEAKATTQAAGVDVEQARIAVTRAWKNISTAEESVTSARKANDEAKQRLDETTVFAPSDGMVLKRSVQIGSVALSGKSSITGGTVLMEIADVSQIYAVVNVDEADIGQVRELAPASARPGPTATQPVMMRPGTLDTDDPVEVTIETFKDEKFHGLIERIAPQSEVIQAIAKFKVWVRITSRNREKLIGLLNTQADAHFTAKSVKNAILISYDAMQKNPNGDDYGVFVPIPGPDKYKFKTCEFGDNNGIDVEVKSGLEDGQEVYTKLPMMTRKEREAEDKKN